jgi:hypothetical protein
MLLLPAAVTYNTQYSADSVCMGALSVNLVPEVKVNIEFGV